jgi:MFS family permease
MLLSVKIISIILSAAVLIALAVKKPELSGFFEKAGLFGIFLFALFIPVKDGFAIFGMVTAVIFFIAHKIAKRDISVPGTGFNAPLLIYAAVVIASFFWTYSIKDSFNEGGEIVYFTLFFFAAAGLLNTGKRINFMVYTFTFAICAAIIYGFFQGIFINALHSSNRLTGLIGNWVGFPVQVSYGLIVITAYYLLNFKKRDDGSLSLIGLIPGAASGIFLGIILLLGFFDIAFAKARSAWIGIIPAIFVLMYLKSKKLFFAVLILLLVLNIGIFSVSKTFKSRIFSMFNPKIYKLELKNHGDIESHIALIESAWAVFKRYPLTGVGVGAFSKYFDEHKEVRFPWYYNPKTGKKFYDLYDNWPENGYMQTLAETGIFSFIALMWLFVLALKIPYRLFRESDDKFKRKIAAMTIGASIIFYGSFAGVSNMSNDQLANLWLFFLALFAGASSLPDVVRRTKV